MDIANNLIFVLHYPSQRFGFFHFVSGFRGLSFYFVHFRETVPAEIWDNNGRVETVRVEQVPGEWGMGGGLGRTPGGSVRGPRRFPSPFPLSPAALGQQDREKPPVPCSSHNQAQRERPKPFIVLWSVFLFCGTASAVLRSHFQTPSWRHGHNGCDPGEERRLSPNPAEPPPQLPAQLSRLRPPPSFPARAPPALLDWPRSARPSPARRGRQGRAPGRAAPQRLGSGGKPREAAGHSRLGPARPTRSHVADSSPRPRLPSLQAQLPGRAKERHSKRQRTQNPQPPLLSGFILYSVIISGKE